jgi:predicted dinucleotide-binding enzyme
MKVAVIGNGTIGGGLGDRWERSGHEVARIGREGGDVSDADAVLIAVPGSEIADVFETVRGLSGMTVMDATNPTEGIPEGFDSNTAFVKAKTGGPTVMSFNLNFGSLYERLDEAPTPPGNIWCGDEEARDTVEQLIRDAGFEPLYAGPIDDVGIRQGFLALANGIAKHGNGPFFYWMTSPPPKEHEDD